MVDILLATYNSEKYLEEQVRSILNQTCKDWRLLIRDDGSTDRTVEMIRQYVDDYAGKLYLIEDDRTCGSAARNFFELMQHADADYVMFCDHDDYWLPDKIEVTLKSMKREERMFGDVPILVFTDYELADENLKKIQVNEKNLQVYHPRADLNHLLVQNYITGCTVMVNKKLYKRMVNYSEHMLMHDWWLALYAAAAGRIVYLPQKTLLYRQHGDNCVGAANVRSLRYVWGKLFDPGARGSFQKHYAQAESFYKEFGNELPNGSRIVLNNFLKMAERNKLQRIYWLFKGRYLKGNFLRVLGQVVNI